jgi:hypothetical protein
VRYSDASSSSNGSKEGKDKQRLKRSSSGTDLQHNIDRFQHDELYNLKKPRIEDNPKSIDRAKEQPTQEIEKAIEQRAQAIMDKGFGNITELLADFEKQGVRFLDTGESSSAADTPLPSQKHSEESTSDVFPDEFLKILHEAHTTTFNPVFQAVFEQACRENQSEGDAPLQASAEAHQLAYKRAFLKAKELVLQQELQKVKQEGQKLDQSIQERCQAAMFSEIEKNLSGDVQAISQSFVVGNYYKECFNELLINLNNHLQSNNIMRNMYHEAISKINRISSKYYFKSSNENMQLLARQHFNRLLLDAIRKNISTELLKNASTELSKYTQNIVEYHGRKQGYEKLEYDRSIVKEYFKESKEQCNQLNQTITNIRGKFLRQGIKIDTKVLMENIFGNIIKKEIDKIKQENTSHR